MQEKLNIFSTKDDKANAAEVIYEVLSDFFFDKVTFLTSPGNSNSTATTSTSNYKTLLRVPDTSRGKYLRPDRKSKFRALFYVSGGVEQAEFMILSPAMYRDDTLASDVANLDLFDSFVGIKVVGGVISLISKSRGVTKESTIPTKLYGETTYLIEMTYGVKSINIRIDNKHIGTISCDLQEFKNDQITMYPFFCPIKSTDGTSVNLNFENYQFLQDR
jgi:hypothetical protein